MRVVSYESEVLGLCQALVRIKSLSGREGALAELVIREMGLLGYDRVDCDALGSVTGVVEGAQPGRTHVSYTHLKILEGGADKCMEAGAIIAGGHSIEDEEVKYLSLIHISGSGCPGAPSRGRST